MVIVKQQRAAGSVRAPLPVRLVLGLCGFGLMLFPVLVSCSQPSPVASGVSGSSGDSGAKPDPAAQPADAVQGGETSSGALASSEEGTSEAKAQAVAGTDSAVRTAWVSAQEGLRVRDAANTGGKVLTLLPYRAEVLVLQEKPEVVEIGGVRGKWTEVEWESYRGWAFGGYLTMEAATVLAPESVANLAEGSLAWPIVKDGVVYQCAIDFSEPGWETKKIQDDPRSTRYSIKKGNALISIPTQGKGGPDGSQTTARAFVPLSPLPFELERVEVKVGRVTWSVLYRSKQSELSISIEAMDATGLRAEDIGVFDRALRTLRLVKD